MIQDTAFAPSYISAAARIRNALKLAAEQELIEAAIALPAPEAFSRSTFSNS